jgi:hypothetical protein
VHLFTNIELSYFQVMWQPWTTWQAVSCYRSVVWRGGFISSMFIEWGFLYCWKDLNYLASYVKE